MNYFTVYKNIHVICNVAFINVISIGIISKVIRSNFIKGIVAVSFGRLQPYSQILDFQGKLCRDKHSSFFPRNERERKKKVL